jgi:hypothetical protein
MVWLWAVPVLVLGFGVVLLFRFLFGRAPLACHFCLKRAPSHLRNRREHEIAWTCSFCGSHNGFTEDGDYLRPPRTDLVDENRVFCVRPARKGPFDSEEAFAGLCRPCQAAEELWLATRGRAGETAGAEARLCAECEARVAERLAAVDRGVRGLYIDRSARLSAKTAVAREAGSSRLGGTLVLRLFLALCGTLGVVRGVLYEGVAVLAVEFVSIRASSAAGAAAALAAVLSTLFFQPTGRWLFVAWQGLQVLLLLFSWVRRSGSGGGGGHLGALLPPPPTPPPAVSPKKGVARVVEDGGREVVRDKGASEPTIQRTKPLDRLQPDAVDDLLDGLSLGTRASGKRAKPVFSAPKIPLRTRLAWRSSALFEQAKTLWRERIRPLARDVMGQGRGALADKNVQLALIAILLAIVLIPVLLSGISWLFSAITKESILIVLVALLVADRWFR